MLLINDNTRTNASRSSYLSCFFSPQLIENILVTLQQHCNIPVILREYYNIAGIFCVARVNRSDLYTLYNSIFQMNTSNLIYWCNI